MLEKRLLAGIKYLAYLAIGITPLIFYRFTMYPFYSVKVAVFQSLVELIVGLYLILVFVNKKYIPKVNPVNISLGVFVLASLASSIFGVDFLRSLWSNTDRQLGLAAFAHFAIFGVILGALGKEFDWKRFWKISVYSAVLVSLLAFFQKYTISDFLLTHGGNRPGSTFGNSAFTGGYLLLNLFVSLWLSFIEKTWQRKIFAVATLIILAGIFLTETIGIIFGLFIGFASLLVFFAVFGKEKKKLARAILATILLFVGGLYLTREMSFWEKIPGLRRVANISATQTDVQDRFISWESNLKGFPERPLLGYGPENTNIPFNKNYNPRLMSLGGLEGTLFDKPHNAYVEQLVSLGILGFLAFVGMFAAFFYALVSLVRKPGDLGSGEYSYWIPFFGAGVLAHMAQNFIIFDTFGTYLMWLSIFGFAGSVYWSVRHKDEKEELSKSKINPLVYFLAVLTIVPIFTINYPHLKFTNNYYWMINNFLNGAVSESVAAYERGLAQKSPYEVYLVKDFAGIVKDGIAQGVDFGNNAELQKEILAKLEEKIGAHEQDYYLHITIADLYVAFYQFGGDGYLTKARQHIDRALELSPNRQQAYYIIARIELSRGNKTGTIEALKKAVEIDPNVGDTRFFYGLIAYEFGDIKTGDEQIAKAKELGRVPKTAQEAMNLAVVIGDRKGDYKEAVRILEGAVELARTSTSKTLILNARLRLAVAYYMAEQYGDAKVAFSGLAKDIDFRTLPMWPQLGPVLRELGVVVDQ